MTALVIGVGNPDRGDDGVGWRVVDLLDGRVAARCSSGDPASLIEAFDGHDRVVLVDASMTGVAAGTVATGVPGRVASRSAQSSHGFALEQTIELADALGVLPTELSVIAIEGKRFEHGTALSLEVEAAAHEVARSLLASLLPPPARIPF